MPDDENVIRLAEFQDSGELPPTSEEAIALEFAARHAEALRHVAAWGQWLHYDGSRWLPDETLHAFDLARVICREVAAGYEKPASTVASAKCVAAVERLAKADRRLAAAATQWDDDGWAFNTGEP
jgi:putative DNA primase/helicase